jgi:hypothetical protein
MDLVEAIGIIKEKKTDSPSRALDVAKQALEINDGTCGDCGTYRLYTKGEYVHPFECEFKDRSDHNLTGFRKLLRK